MGMACLSKLASSIITYPALVLRSRLQVGGPIPLYFIKLKFFSLFNRSDHRNLKDSLNAVRGLGHTKACEVAFLQHLCLFPLVDLLAYHQQRKGFYAGFWPNVWKVMPNAIITFIAYEHIAKMLVELRSTQNKDD